MVAFFATDGAALLGYMAAIVIAGLCVGAAAGCFKAGGVIAALCGALFVIAALILVVGVFYLGHQEKNYQEDALSENMIITTAGRARFNDEFVDVNTREGFILVAIIAPGCQVQVHLDYDEITRDAAFWLRDGPVSRQVSSSEQLRSLVC